MSNNPFRRRWPDITSPRARQVVSAAFDLAPLIPENPPAGNYLDVNDSEFYDYQEWIAAQLKASSLAQRLVDGELLLPDYYAALPLPWSFFAKLNRPRNYVQLVNQIAEHLPWYISRESYDAPLRTIVSEWLALVGMGMALLVLLVVVPLGGSLAVLGILLVPALRLTWGDVLLNRASGRFVARMIHTAELYYYLCAAYADPPEYDDAPGMLAAEELHQQARLRAAQRAGGRADGAQPAGAGGHQGRLQ
jgi:hypothetical protein